jgi:hypothetical protein
VRKEATTTATFSAFTATTAVTTAVPAAAVRGTVSEMRWWFVRRSRAALVFSRHCFGNLFALVSPSLVGALQTTRRELLLGRPSNETRTFWSFLPVAFFKKPLSFALKDMMITSENWSYNYFSYSDIVAPGRFGFPQLSSGTLPLFHLNKHEYF